MPRRAAPIILALAIANLGQAPAVKGGTVTGRVRAAVKGEEIATSDLWVYLESTAKPRHALGAGVVAKVVQKDTEFWPRVTVIPIGAKVYFPNRDAQDHNVFSPAVKANSWFGFDLGRYGPNKVGRMKPFLVAGEFDIYCDIHKNMCAKVKVVPTRYFAHVVGGRFELTDVPPGRYTVVAWAPNSGESRSTQPVEVEVGATREAEPLNVQLKTDGCKHTRIGGGPYGPYP